MEKSFKDDETMKAAQLSFSDFPNSKTLESIRDSRESQLAQEEYVQEGRLESSAKPSVLKRTSTVLTKYAAAMAILTSLVSVFVFNILFQFQSAVGISSSIGIGIITFWNLSSKSKIPPVDPANFVECNFVISACELLEIYDPEIKRSARKSLVRHLPNLRAGDSDFIDPKYRKLFRHELYRRELVKESEYVDFQVVVLKALETIGTAEDIPYVKLLAELQSEDCDQSAMQAAKACLPILQARLSNEEERTQLLRASSFTSSGTNELLHPAKGSADCDPETLLRHSKLKE